MARWLPRAAKPPGPVLIWNLIRRCNPTCKHCYALSADHDYPGERSTDEVFTVMDDLKALRVWQPPAPTMSASAETASPPRTTSSAA